MKINEEDVARNGVVHVLFIKLLTDRDLHTHDVSHV